MRRLVALVAVAAALVAGVAAVATVTLSRLVDANRERIVAEVADELGRPVRVEGITVGFRRGLAIVLDGLRIGEDPAFGQEDFLTAARAYAVVSLWPLMRGRIAVRRVVVVAPRATIVRTARGTSLDSLGRRREAGRRPGPSPTPRETPATSSSSKVPAALVAFVSLEDGELRLVDRRRAEPVETTVAPIELWLSDPSLTEPVGFRARATVAGTDPVDLEVRGRVGPVGDPPFGQDVPISLMVGATGGALWISNVEVEGRVRRDADGRPVATAHVSAPTLRAAGVDMRSFTADVSDEGGVATIRSLAVQALGGTIEARGRVDHRGPVVTFAVEPTVRGVDVSQALAVRAPDDAARFRGRLDVDGSISGTAGDDAVVRRTLGGQVRVAVRDGLLTDVNVADSVLSGLTGLGGLATLVPARVRQRHPEIFATDDMRFDELRADLRLGGGRIDVDPVVLRTKDYAVRGTGLVTFLNRVEGDATLVASEQLTTDVVAGFPGTESLTNDAGRLAVPFHVTGVLPDVRAKADRDFVNRALEKVLVGAGLERLLGGSKRKHEKRPLGKGPNARKRSGAQRR